MDPTNTTCPQPLTCLCLTFIHWLLKQSCAKTFPNGLCRFVCDERMSVFCYVKMLTDAQPGIQICSNDNLSSEEILFKWEAFSYNSVASTPSAGTSRTIQAQHCLPNHHDHAASQPCHPMAMLHHDHTTHPALQPTLPRPHLPLPALTFTSLL